MNALFSILGVMGSDRVQMKGTYPKKSLSKKKIEIREISGKFLGISVLRREISGKYFQHDGDRMKNDAEVDLLGVSG